MQITDYTSYAEVRVVLGVSSKELSDTQLALDMFGDELYQELSTVSGTLAPDTVERSLDGQFTYITSVAENSRTDNQKLLLSYITQYALYISATLAANSLSMAAPKGISDGKASTVRFSSEATFKDTVQAAYDKRFDLKRKIQELIGITVTEKTFVERVQPDTDIITNTSYV